MRHIVRVTIYIQRVVLNTVFSNKIKNNQSCLMNSSPQSHKYDADYYYPDFKYFFPIFQSDVPKLICAWKIQEGKITRQNINTGINN